MLKPSRRAAVVAASFALGLSCVGPYAHAGLLGGDDSESTTVEGLPVPVGGELLGGGLLGEDGVLGLLGGDLLGSVLGEDGLLGVVGGDVLGSLPAGDVLGGAGLPVDGLLGDGLPVVGGVLGGDDGVLAGEGVVGVLGGLADLGAVVPGAGSIFGVLTAFSDSGSLVPGLQVLNEAGVLGLLGSL